ncbi:apolipoprotein D-like [Neocloeon triangulifer]|uniref:apolipoprotein D-like n=1 Tax=Neocloeon triangulifer TaxID=2078957 RepID=UPI00286F983B|nr:apolipoprotein D-like [Neocloeon triangulifer]
MIFLFVAAAVCLAGVNAQIVNPGPCPNVTLEQQFDLPAYLGRWYEYKKYFALFQRDGSCVSATYTDNQNGTVGVRNYLVKPDTGEVETIIGYAEVDSDSGEGKLLVSFPSVGQYGSPYWILGTDYTSYTVVWACGEVGNDNLQYGWLLTRERFPSNETLDLAQQVITANQLDEKFIITPQENCPLDP